MSLCSSDAWLKDLGSGCVSEPQRGPTVGGKIISPRRVCSIFGAPTSAKVLRRRFHGLNFGLVRASAKILRRRSYGLIMTLSWPLYFDMWLMASFFGLVRASAKILRPRSYGLNVWPPESIGEDLFTDGLVAQPSPSVVLCSRASSPFLYSLLLSLIHI